MCLGNRAESSANYINSQLAVLYENAQRCTEKHGNGLKPTMSAIEYATCLFEYYGPGKHSRYQPSRHDLTFFATFGRPRVEFVCNHEVILFLELQEGHYNLDVNKATPKPELHETIEHYTIAFRVNFKTHSLDKFHCAEIGNSESYTMNMHVLDVDSAEFVAELSHLPGTTGVSDESSYYTKERKLGALTHYLTKHYLQTFKRAGYHVLYALPDFDNLSITTAHIDYSVISKRTLSTDKIYGISVEDINTYLRGLWLQAASYVDEHGFPHDNSAVDKHFLAELRTSWTDTVEDIHMHLYFGPLHVRPLCKREVVMYLDIQDIEVHLGGGFNEHPNHKLSDFKLAFIVDIVYEESTDHITKRIKLNLSSARYCEHLSILGEFHDIELLTRIRTTLVRYVTTYYLRIIETTKTTSIYHHDESIHSTTEEIEIIGESGDEGGSETHEEYEEEYHVHDCTCEDEGSCGHTGGIRWGILQKGLYSFTETCGFDLVTSVTQASLNAYFKGTWDLARRRIRNLDQKTHTWSSSELEIETCIADYSFVHPQHGDEVFFAASFAPPKIQLLCKEGSHSVIFYLQLVEGYLKTLGSGKSLQPGSQAHPFSSWRLAFEVDLKLIDATEETIEKNILKRLGRQDHSGFKQLVLDLSSAKFNLNLSTVPGLLGGGDNRLIRARREALLYYIQTCYFPAFNRAHHQVLYTIPVHDQYGLGNFFHTLTSLRFQIIPFNYGQGESYLEGIFGRHRSIFKRNTIVFTGMVDGKPLPPHGLPRGINWAVGDLKEVPHGMICLSRKTFLEARILTLLELVNRDTTIVPSFSGVDDGEWILKLTTWGQHETKKRRACHWHEVTKDSNSLDFVWKNRDDWRYEYEGDVCEGDVDGSGLYHVSCTTRNILSIPTTRRGTSAISIKGNTELALSYNGNGKDWSAKMSATWSAAIMFTSDASGLKVHISPTKIVPDFRTTHAEGSLGHSTHEKAFEDLKGQFPTVIDFSAIVDELKRNFEGCWSGLHVNSREFMVYRPFFNKHGDLMLELGVRAPVVDTGLNGTAVTNGHANESWFRHAVHKAGEVVQSVVTPPPYYAPPFPLLRGSSKTSLSQSTVTRTSTLEVADEVEFEDHQSIDEEDL